jgi:hypothetical protein
MKRIQSSKSVSVLGAALCVALLASLNAAASNPGDGAPPGGDLSPAPSSRLLAFDADHYVYMPLILYATVEACVPDPPGESDNIDDAIKVCSGQRVTGLVNDDDWDDVFKIVCKQGERLQLTLTGPNPDADLYVFAPDATDVNDDDPIAWSDEFDTSNEYIDFQIPYAGTWYISVYSYQGSINYTLDINLAGAASGQGR